MFCCHLAIEQMDGMFVRGSSVTFCAPVTTNILPKTAMLVFYPQQIKINVSLEEKINLSTIRYVSGSDSFIDFCFQNKRISCLYLYYISKRCRFCNDTFLGCVLKFIKMMSKVNRQFLCYVVILLFQVSVTFEDIRVH